MRRGGSVKGLSVAAPPEAQLPAPRRRKPLTAVLQARVTRSEHEILESLARQHGITLSEAVRLGAWGYLLARAAGPAGSGDPADPPARLRGRLRALPDDAVS
jgi:hypothetical protein